jgi:hypothetical protein
VAAGVSSILNFAPTVLVVPDHVEVRKVDMSIELQILAFHEQRKVSLEAVPGVVPTRLDGRTNDMADDIADDLPDQLSGVSSS